MEEHRTLMDMVIEKVQSVKSRLNEAYTSLLRGFEVCALQCLLSCIKECMCIDSSP